MTTNSQDLPDSVQGQAEVKDHEGTKNTEKIIKTPSLSY